MSAILSADDLNDFISPGVACIKPVETLPKRQSDTESSKENDASAYEVKIGEEKRAEEEEAAAALAGPKNAAEAAQISLTDCLACSGCVTSAEAVLVSLQSHTEVLKVLDEFPALEVLGWSGRRTLWQERGGADGGNVSGAVNGNGDSVTTNLDSNNLRPKLFVATVSPQTRASLAAAFGISQRRAGYIIEQLLSGPDGLKAGGRHGSSFALVLDSNVFREIALEAAFEEVRGSRANTNDGHVDGGGGAGPRRPVLASACPGWICYVEKTHPHILPYLSRLKSPQALAGTFVKSILSRRFGILPSDIWHMALMPCFDKKLEASRSELTSMLWAGDKTESEAVRDVDCVITARELLQLAAARNITLGGNFSARSPQKRKRGDGSIGRQSPPSVFSDPLLDEFVLTQSRQRPRVTAQIRDAGPSGGYLWHILQRTQALHPGSSIKVQRGRNIDVLEYAVVRSNEVILRAARCYGFRNIQNLVRKLRPAKTSSRALGRNGAMTVGKPRRKGPTGSSGGMEDFAYIEVMACPGGCTNGGGQIRVEDLPELGRAVDFVDAAGEMSTSTLPVGQRVQKNWLAQVDEAYFSAEPENDSDCHEQSSMDEDYDNTNFSTNDGIDVFIKDDEQQAHDSMSYNQSHSSDSLQHLAHDNVKKLCNEQHGNNADEKHSMGNDLDRFENQYINAIIERWSSLTSVGRNTLLYTTYRQVESDVGKDKDQSDMQRVAGLASAVGGGW